MKKIFTLFVLGTFLLPGISLAAVDVLAGGWWDASIDELLSAKKQIDAQIIALGGQIENEASQNDTNYSSGSYQANFGFIDHEMFSECLIGDMSGRVLRCGSDFEPGDYYIFSLWGANALFGVSDTPNGFSYSYERVMRKIYVEKGQYIMLLDAVLVEAEQLNSGELEKYGIFLVGKDLPAGEYKIETLSDRYTSDDYCIEGIIGAYQISRNNPENEPIDCSSLFSGSTYITVNEGDYIVINNAKMSLCVDSSGKGVVSPVSSLSFIPTPTLITTPSATSSPTVTPKVITNSDVEAAIEQILNYRNAETDKAYAVIQEYYPYMTDEQKEKCLLSYGRWMCVEKAEEHIIEHLNDPYSYRRYGGNVDSQAVLIDEEYRITVTLDYGAKNQFGGMSRVEKELYVYFKLDLKNGNVVFTDVMMANVMERYVD
ncbi:MAG: hypothetical protein IJB85_12805 [Clostridia bacterium]|nr:hypothetical protein [Clostridia bacterium]